MVSKAVFILSFAAFAALLTSTAAQAPDLFVPVQPVGGQGGSPAVLYGCTDDGATVSMISVWSNDDFIRGMQIFLTDGRSSLFGCVNTTLASGPFIGCLDSGIRNDNFTFAAGETITSLTTWPGSYTGSDGGSDKTRAGALNFTTSQGRVFDFGMTVERSTSTSVSVGSGIFCGVNQNAGDDVNSIGFMFLEPISSSVLTNASYAGIPASKVDNNGLDVTVDKVIVDTATLDNSMNTSWHSYSSQQLMSQQLSFNWSQASGLDSILNSSVSAEVPAPALTNSNRTLSGWTLASNSTQERASSGNVSVPWSYDVLVPGGGITNVTASTHQASISSVSYSANLTVQLNTGANFTIPVQGVFSGMSYTPIVVDTNVVKTAPPPPPPPSPAAATSTQAGNFAPSTEQGSQGSGSSTNGAAIALGVLLGVVCCLLFLTLFLLVRDRRRRRETTESDSETGTQSGNTSNSSGLYLLWGSLRGNSRFWRGPRSRSSCRTQRSVDPRDFGVPDGPLSESDVAGAQPLPEAYPNPKSSMDMDNDPEAATALKGSGAEGKGQQAQRGSVPYTLYRNLRLDSIRSALGLGRRPSSDAPAQAQEGGVEMRNSSEQPDPKADAVSAANTPTARAVSGVHWGFPVGQRQQAPVDPAEPPAKSSFHQSCDPVLTDNPTFDGDNPAEEPVLTQNPTYEHDSADEDTGFVDCDDSISVSGGSQTGPGSSSGGADDHFAELKYLRPGHEDEDNLLVEPTHGRIQGFGSKPAPENVMEDSKKQGKKVVEHEDTTIRLGERSRTPQPDKRIMVEDVPVSLGEKYHAPDTRNQVQFDDAQLQLGFKYRTQGRNE